MKNCVKIFSVAIMALFTCFLVWHPKAEAATLSSVKDTVSTSRPSASSPLSAAVASGVTQVTVFDNGSIYIASDAATVKGGVGDGDEFKTVASMSAQITGPVRRNIYLTGTLSDGHAEGLPVIVPITALHSVNFTTIASIPSNGNIIITFPSLGTGDANNAASPSATTFQMNALSSTQIIVTDGSSDITTTHFGGTGGSITVTNPSAGTSPTVTLNVDDDSTITGNTTLYIFLGCTAGSTTTCTTQSPRIINPTKTAAAGTADTWKMNIKTTDASSIGLDSANIRIATIDSVQVQAQVEPLLTFTIGGIANGAAVNTGNTTGCTATETTNAGIASTATFVDLGSLGNTPSTIDLKIGNIAAQLLTVTTNASGGYAITATSSGRLRDDASGQFISSSTTPAAFPSGNDWFGINACGLDVSTGTWGAASCQSEITGSSDPCNYGWPTQTSSVTLASDTTGPSGNSVTTGNGLTTVRYAAGVDAIVPAGIYKSTITYVATATF